MSWVDWVNGYIINHTESSGEQVFGICRRGVIAAAADGAIWGETNFAFQTYEMEMMNDNDEKIKGQVNEFANLLNAWEGKGKCTGYGGLRFNNEKFVLSKFDEDSNTMYLTSKDAGGEGGSFCVTKSEQCFVIGVSYKGEPAKPTTSSGGNRNYSAGNSNAAVENCRDKLVEAGY